jgi:hypothetical protein
MAPLIRVPGSGKRTGDADYRDLIRFCLTFLVGPVDIRPAVIPGIRAAKQPPLVIAS